MAFEYKEFPLNLDLVEGTSAQSSNKKISLSQRDIGVSKILFSLTFRNVAYPIPAGAKVRLFIKRYNSGIVMQDQTPETGAHVSVTDATNGKIEVLLNSDSIANAGQAEAQIEIELAPGKIMTSQKFSFFIESALGADGKVISGNDIPLLDKAIAAGEKLKDADLDAVLAVTNDVAEIKGEYTDLTGIVAYRDSLPYQDVNYLKEKYYPSDTDYTNAFKKAQSAKNSQFFYSAIKFTNKTGKYNFNISNPIILKNNCFISFEPGAEITFTGSATSIFKNDPTSASLFLRVYGGGRFEIGNRTLFDFSYSRAQAFGFNLAMDDIKVIGTSGAREGNVFKGGFTDFLSFYKCSFEYLKQPINITAFDEQRGNTQMMLENIYMKEVDIGVEATKIDKGSFKNVDIAHCRKGFLFHKNNTALELVNCHVEYYDDTAFEFDNCGNINVKLELCTCFLPNSTAKAGFKSRQIEWTDSSQNSFLFVDCDFIKSYQAGSITGYVPFYCPSPFEWRGNDFEYVDARKVNNDYPVGSAKIYTRLSVSEGKNLLQNTNFSDSSLFHIKDGSYIITGNETDYYNGVRIKWTPTAANKVTTLKTLPLKVGWHTLVVKASQIGDANIGVIVQKPNFGFQFIQNIAELSYDYRDALRPLKTGIKSQTLFLPFKVETAGEYYVGLYASQAIQYDVITSFFGVFEGFITEFREQERSYRKSAAPTSGYYYKDEIVYNTNVSSGQKIGWKCVVSGDAATTNNQWVSIGTYGTP